MGGDCDAWPEPGRVEGIGGVAAPGVELGRAGGIGMDEPGRRVGSAGAAAGRGGGVAVPGRASADGGALPGREAGRAGGMGPAAESARRGGSAGAGGVVEPEGAPAGRAGGTDLAAGSGRCNGSADCEDSAPDRVPEPAEASGPDEPEAARAEGIRPAAESARRRGSADGDDDIDRVPEPAAASAPDGTAAPEPAPAPAEDIPPAAESARRRGSADGEDGGRVPEPAGASGVSGVAEPGGGDVGVRPVTGVVGGVTGGIGRRRVVVSWGVSAGAFGAPGGGVGRWVGRGGTSVPGAGAGVPALLRAAGGVSGKRAEACGGGGVCGPDQASPPTTPSRVGGSGAGAGSGSADESGPASVSEPMEGVRWPNASKGPERRHGDHASSAAVAVSRGRLSDGDDPTVGGWGGRGGMEACCASVLMHPPVSSRPGRLPVRGPSSLRSTGRRRASPSRARIPVQADRHPDACATAAVPPYVRVTLRAAPVRTGTSPRARGICPERPPTLR
ncbi:hypothetical protein EDD92_2008 [Streptomyces sp. TLI_185]|nr:hypothetical protein EDD92_2008 [Streptomyces sp. TLI_185]